MVRVTSILVLTGLLAQAAVAGEWDLGTDRDAFTPCTHCVAPGATPAS